MHRGLVCLCLLAAPAFADETAAKLTLAIESDKKVDLWVTRSRGDDGSLTLKLIARGLWPKPQALTLYSGGGDDDGYGDDDVRRVTAHSFDVGGGKKIAKIDITYKPPDGKKVDEQVDTILVGFDGKTHKMLELTTKRSRNRSKVCRETDQIDLSADGPTLTASRHLVREAALGDDDLPVDKSCRSPKDVAKKYFKLTGGQWVESEEPPPAEAPPVAATPPPAATPTATPTAAPAAAPAEKQPPAQPAKAKAPKPGAPAESDD
jgi:hypothetical protein